MGGPRRGDSATDVSIRVERTLHDRLAAEAARREVSIIYLMRRALRTALDAWEAQDLP